MEMLPWAAVSVLLVGVLAVWNYAVTTRRDGEEMRKELEEFKVKVAENYTTTVALDRTANTLAKAMDELKTELREFRREIHGSRGFPATNRG
jgi:septal ring factor EnvC (AmiA/AmiB activator)